MNNSRTVNSARNVAASIGGQFVGNLLRFVCRTVFIYTLGKQYLGISGLYTNILTLLSMTELGFSTAVAYSLYKPLVEEDHDTIRSLMAFYRKCYRIIGLVIFGVGLCLMPFLPRLMNGATDVINIYEYYLLYLIQTVVSYLFFAYKATLLQADQKKYLYDLTNYLVLAVTLILQTIVLVVWKSFFVYTVLAILGNIAFNAITAWMTDRRYPYLKEKAQPLKPELRSDIFSRVYAMALYKICGSVGTATDSLIISAFEGIVMVGLFENYDLVMKVAQSLFSSVFKAFSASVGNLFASEKRERSEFVFRCLNLLCNVTVVLCSALFLGLFQPLIRVWIGEDYLLPQAVLVIMVFNFATNYLQSAVQIYREATGVFVKGKYRAAATVILNLVLSLILVRYWGIAGVLMGSIISRMATTGWYDVCLLYHDAFGASPVKFFRDFAAALLILSGAGLATWFAAGSLPLLWWPAVLLRFVMSAGIPMLAFWLLYGRSEEWKYVQSRIAGILTGLFQRVRK